MAGLPPADSKLHDFTCFHIIDPALHEPSRLHTVTHFPTKLFLIFTCFDDSTELLRFFTHVPLNKRSGPVNLQMIFLMIQIWRTE